MALKTILVCLNDVAGNGPLIAAAASLAAKADAHVTGLYVIPAPQVYPSAGIDFIPIVIDTMQAFFKEKAAAVQSEFEMAMVNAGLRSDFRKVESTDWMISAAVLNEARHADLVMLKAVNQQTSTGLELDFVERLLTGLGRPTLIMPDTGTLKLGFGEAIIAWNSSREAARAAADAVPLLKLFETVRIVTVDAQKMPEAGGRLAGTDLAQALARHGIKATAEVYDSGGLEPGAAILEHARDRGANLVVSGAYGHSRFREFILGGSTVSILQGLDRPVLMAH